MSLPLAAVTYGAADNLNVKVGVWPLVIGTGAELGLTYGLFAGNKWRGVVSANGVWAHSSRAVDVDHKISSIYIRSTFERKLGERKRLSLTAAYLNFHTNNLLTTLDVDSPMLFPSFRGASVMATFRKFKKRAYGYELTAAFNPLVEVQSDTNAGDFTSAGDAAGSATGAALGPSMIGLRAAMLFRGKGGGLLTVSFNAPSLAITPYPFLTYRRVLK